MRGGAKHFTYSKIMAWVAFDRAIKSADEFGMDGPVDDWKAHRAAIQEDVCQRGYDEQQRPSFRSTVSPQLDAVPAADPGGRFLAARRSAGDLDH